MSLSCNLREAHFHNLHSQSNVYGLAKICLRNDINKLLIATLRGKVMSMEYHNLFSAREVHFTYIPGKLISHGMSWAYGLTILNLKFKMNDRMIPFNHIS
jgi:hypothetical protein